MQQKFYLFSRRILRTILRISRCIFVKWRRRHFINRSLSHRPYFPVRIKRTEEKFSYASISFLERKETEIANFFCLYFFFISTNKSQFPAKFQPPLLIFQTRFLFETRKDRSISRGFRQDSFGGGRGFWGFLVISVDGSSLIGGFGAFSRFSLERPCRFSVSYSYLI